MFRIREAIVVEGRYDKNALSQVVDTLILETSGFGIFRNPEQMALLRRAAQRRGLVVLTDSDGAGFVIRNRIRGAVPPEQVKHAYIPDRYGKERRKRRAGREGKLGVEGMPPQVLEQALRRAGVTVLEEDGSGQTGAVPPLTKADLFAAGLTGTPDSALTPQPVYLTLTDGSQIDLTGFGGGIRPEGESTRCEISGVFDRILPLDTIESITIGESVIPLTTS